MGKGSGLVGTRSDAGRRKVRASKRREWPGGTLKALGVLAPSCSSPGFSEFGLERSVCDRRSARPAVATPIVSWRRARILVFLTRKRTIIPYQERDHTRTVFRWTPQDHTGEVRARIVSGGLSAAVVMQYNSEEV